MDPARTKLAFDDNVGLTWPTRRCACLVYPHEPRTVIHRYSSCCRNESCTAPCRFGPAHKHRRQRVAEQQVEHVECVTQRPSKVTAASLRSPNAHTISGAQGQCLGEAFQERSCGCWPPVERFWNGFRKTGAAQNGFGTLLERKYAWRTATRAQRAPG